MRSRNILFAAIFVLQACQRFPEKPAEAYQHWTDRMIIRLGLQNVHVLPCEGAKQIDECFKMRPLRRWSGAWITSFEAYRFCPGKSFCSWDKEPRYDLSWSREVLKDRSQIRVKTETVYAVEFIGRRTEYPIASFGREYPIVVDRLISMKEVGKVDGVERRMAFSISAE